MQTDIIRSHKLRVSNEITNVFSILYKAFDSSVSLNSTARYQELAKKHNLNLSALPHPNYHGENVDPEAIVMENPYVTAETLKLSATFLFAKAK